MKRKLEIRRKKEQEEGRRGGERRRKKGKRWWRGIQGAELGRAQVFSVFHLNLIKTDIARVLKGPTGNRRTGDRTLKVRGNNGQDIGEGFEGELRDLKDAVRAVGERHSHQIALEGGG